MESVTILVGPISESATEMRVGVPFTSQRFAPTEVRWIYSHVIKIVKKGQDYFPETKPGTQQEEKVVPLTASSAGAVRGEDDELIGGSPSQN